MKHVKTILSLSGLGLALGLAAQLDQPAQSHGFSLLGHDLKNGQRDFRVFNNFTDSSANNNNTPDANFPGVFGADMSIWKGQVEWGSGLWAGTGDGDPLQNLGNGGANFESHTQGSASGVGSIGNNIHSQIGGSGGGVLAFMQGGGSGWWIRYYENINWSDGPGGTGGAFDLQAVACHEIGHAIGLGHSGTGSATMAPSIGPGSESERSIAADDIAGLQAVYGVEVASKPDITSLGGSFDPGGTLVINGSDFATTGNEVWFTDTNSNGTATKVFNVNSTGGGTQLSVTIPADAADGNVMVNNGDGAHVGLSNAWPIDIGSAPVGNPPIVDSFTPANGPAGGFTELTITGDNFNNGTSAVRVASQNALSFQVDSDSQITAVTPPNVPFSSGLVEVDNTDGTGQSGTSYFYLFNPAPDVDTVSPNSGDVAGGTLVTISGTTVVGTTTVQFDGIAGGSLTILDENTLTVTTPPGAGNGPVDVVVINSSGTDTLVDGFTYTGGGPGGTFVDLGPSGVGGALGEPTLTGTGDLTPGGAGWTLTIANGPPAAFGTLFIGIGDGSTTGAFKGGTFYVLPIILQVSFNLDLGGGVSLPLPVDAGVVGPVSLVWQWWNADGSAVFGAGGSNGLRTDIP